VGLRKVIAATETLIPEVSSEDHVGDFLQLAVSEFYREVMDGLLKRLQCIRPNKAQSGN
jgi:hypothetical protein